MKLLVRDVKPDPNFVFLHGWGVNNGVFEDLKDRLSPLFNIRFLDLPGFGDNHHIDVSGLSFDQYCTHIAEQIPDNSVVLGWSLGGLVAQRIACLFPEKIKNLVLVCSSPLFEEGEEWPGIKPKVLTAFKSQLELDFEKLLERFLAIQAIGSTSMKQDIKKLKTSIFQYNNPHPSALELGLDFLQNVDLRADLIHCEVETLRIFGAKDSLVPIRVKEHLAELCPNSSVEVFPKASHAPFISHADEFEDVLVKYLT